MMKPYINIDERELLFQLRDGDATAFESLYMRYAEKLSAQLFVKVWENRENIDPEKSFQAYLYRIASNIANDYYRKLSKDKKLATSVLQQITLLYHPEHLTAQIQADKELMRTIEKLPLQRKAVFKLCKLPISM